MRLRKLADASQDSKDFAGHVLEVAGHTGTRESAQPMYRKSGSWLLPHLEKYSGSLPTISCAHDLVADRWWSETSVYVQGIW